MTTPDPIQLALTQNRLDYITRQMGEVMVRTARSPIFSQAHDFTCFVCGPDGWLVSQADGIPIHSGGGGFAVRAVLRDFEGDIEPGDVFVLNDPWQAGGNHLPDWVIARPVFVDDRRVAFACNRAHQSDIGGGAPGAYNPGATDTWQEGVRLPALKLVSRGETRRDLWRLLLANSRTPELQDGDLRAMIGATRIGGERVAEFAEEVSVERALALFDGILDHAERRMRAALAALPDGVYEGADHSDNDCFEPRDVAVWARIVIDGDRASVDLSGSSPQIRGFKNSTWANTCSSVYTRLRVVLRARDPAQRGHLPRRRGDRARRQHRQCHGRRGHHHVHRVHRPTRSSTPAGRRSARRRRNARARAGPRTSSGSPPATTRTAGATFSTTALPRRAPERWRDATASTRSATSARSAAW